MGVLVFGYFLRTLSETRDFSGPDGLIDHELTLQIFWFTKISLFRPWMSLAIFQAIFIFACACSLALILGYRVKLAAAILYVIAVSTYRWNFLVMYVDDAIIHLVLVWMLLLPVGRTLTLKEYLSNRRDAWRIWKCRKAPGATVRCLVWNLALIYLVAGLWKWTSPMWRDGTAIYAVLRLPISLAPEFWGPQHLWILKALDYTTLTVEPLFPLIFVLPEGCRPKYGLLLALLAFHIGSVATLKIPFANLACMAAAVIPFGGELMKRIRKHDMEFQSAGAHWFDGLNAVLALSLVAILTMAMVSSVTLPQWRSPWGRNIQPDAQASTLAATTETEVGSVSEFDHGDHEGLGPWQMAFYAPLWCVGIAQQYQLFNWIDERNYSVRYQVLENDGRSHSRELDSSTMFLQSTRGILLQFNLLGLTWARTPPGRRSELRKSIYTRVARRYCEITRPRGNISVYSTLERITAAKPVSDPSVPNLMMQFSCHEGEPQFQTMYLDP